MGEAWHQALAGALQHGPCVVVTVVEVHGSAPRNPGSRMLVGQGILWGSIGGGNLEWTAQALARSLLEDTDGPACRLESYGLGPALRQCCGGAVELLYERIGPEIPGWLEALYRDPEGLADCLLVTRLGAATPGRRIVTLAELPEQPAAIREAAAALIEGAGALARCASGKLDCLVERFGTPTLDLYLFGAGHVGSAVAAALAALPFQVTWVDGRKGAFPETPPANVRTLASEDPVALAAAAPRDALFLVMTHSHTLDEDLCHAVLSRERVRWLGLIGSATKRARFVHRLAQRGIAEDRLQRLVCPVGEAGIAGKRPATIAVAIAAQLLTEQVPAAYR